MKKFLAILAIAGALTACGNDNNTDSENSTLTTPSTVDSTTVVSPADSTAVEPLVDTVVTDTLKR
jgi:ABC-type glycerol-3-phosphate transport system substrate-binding protein